MVRFYLLLLLLIFRQGFAQVSSIDGRSLPDSRSHSLENHFEHLSVKDGLSTNSVNCILQDREGFLWFGTNDGINKYDGYTFSSIQTNASDSTHRFLNNRISGLCEDYTNRLWAVTEGGLHEINKRTGQVTPHPILASNASRWNYQHSVYEDSRRVLWISTLGGLARYEPAIHQFTLFPLPHPEATIKTVFEDKKHRFWVATWRGLYLFDRATGRFTLVPAHIPPGEQQPTFIAFYLDSQDVLWLGTATAGYGLFRLDLRQQPFRPEPYNPNGKINPFMYLNAVQGDANGIIWAGTTSGLQRIDPLTNQVFTYRPDPNTSKGISSNSAQAIYLDRAGTLWVGTDNGIDRQVVTNKPFMTYQIRPNRGTANLPENKVVALLPDNNGYLWISNGYTIRRTQRDKNQSQIIPTKDLSITNQPRYIKSLQPNGSEGIWIGTDDGLYRFDQASGKYTGYPSKIPAIFVSQAPTGPIWIGGDVEPVSGIASFNPQTHHYSYYNYTPNDPNGLPDKYIHGLLASRTGDVWVLVRKHGICRLHPPSGRFTRYTAGSEGQLNSNDVQTIYEDDKGIIWVGTHESGLNRFDPKTKLFSAITTRDGLPSDNIVGIVSDRKGCLWLSTDKGLCRYNPYTKAVRNYETNDGLPSNDFLPNAVFREKKQLFFGTLNGVVYFNPDSIRDDTRPFPVFITGLKVLDQPRSLTGNTVSLNHDENFVSFGFAALAYIHPEQNQYAYQLVGVDKNWVQNGNRHWANYTNLSPGDYTFRVKAANSDDIWNEKGASIQVIIRPPWWATWWAYTVYALLVGGAIWGYIRFYTNRIRQQQEMELNRREAEQLKTVDELKTRFFSNITHEFRTPLSLIISPVEKLMRESQFDPPTRQTLALVQRNADQLLRLINQLLDLSKLEANHMTVSMMRGEAAEFVEHLVESFRQAAQQKGVTLTYLADDRKQEFLFDADKWEKILTNLLSNALKFTRSGGQINLSCKHLLSSIPSEPSAVSIDVSDTGIGISPEHLPHIFDRFYQVDTSRTRAYEGTGIGLALTKELIDLIGGTVHVTSQPGAGTTFRLTLPVWPLSANLDAPPVILPKPVITDSLPVTTETITSESTDEHQAPLVLIVEDNAELREFLASELAGTYRILRAVDGEDGWNMCQTELPDIVISDVMMPRKDGYELTHLIKNHPDTNHIAVVLLTAKAAHSSRIAGLQEGADEYLAKPFHLDELYLRLRNLMSYQQKLRDQYRQQFAQPDLPSPINIVDDAFLRRVYALLESHLDDPSITVDWLADQLAMSRKTLYRKVHSLTQLAPHELIRQYRLRKAADLLRTGYSASQTAYLTGFKTPSYFTLVFKEFYHKTPTEFVADGLSKA